MPSKKRGSLSGVAPSELADRLMKPEAAQPLSVVAESRLPEPPAMPEPARQPEPAPLVADPDPGLQPAAHIPAQTPPRPRAPRASAPRKTQPAPVMVEPPKRGHAIQASGKVVRRITLSLPPDVGQVLAHFCVESGRTQSDVVAEALREKFR